MFQISQKGTKSPTKGTLNQKDLALSRVMSIYLGVKSLKSGGEDPNMSHEIPE